MSSDVFGVTNEFISENKNLVKPMQKSSSPHTKKDRLRRRQEVHRLHFDLGYSAVRIAELMQINRNTINSDIKYWYSRLSKEWRSFDVGSWYMRQNHRLEIQRTRLINQLEKQKNVSDKLAIERMIFEIDSNTASMMLRIFDYRRRAMIIAEKTFNEYLDKHPQKKDLPRFIIKQELEEIPSKTRKKIDELISKG